MYKRQFPNLLPHQNILRWCDRILLALRYFLRETIQKLFFLVGGSGFYIQALVKGLYPVPPSDPQKRASLETEAKEHGLLALFEELEIIDPAYAKKIGPKDRHRILRALEILRHGPFKTIDEINQLMRAQEKPFHFLQVGLRKTRDSFRNTLRERTFKMLKDGFIDEVEGLLAMGLKDWPPMKSVGYVDVIRYLELSVDNRNKEQLIEDIVTNSMGLAKRQMTWFRRSTGDELPMEWFDTDQEYEAACLRVTELVQGGNISK